MAAIGVAQEFQRVFTGSTYHPDESGGGLPRFGYAKADRRVTAYYFYLVDEAFGPAFIKICAYFPYPVKIWLNGHEYAKRAATAAGISFTELDNGFATTDDPAGLQDICDTLTPGVIRVFCERWWAALPLPLTEADRAGGYWWEVAMRQVEVSRTIVFDASTHARSFFEALCADNLAIGRPEEMQIIFGPRVRRAPEGGYRTRLLRSGDEVTLNAYFRHSRVKSYLKCHRAFRIETVVNDPGDLGLLRGLAHLEELSEGPGPTVRRPSGHRPGRRLMRPRAHHHRVYRSLRAQVATLLGEPYSMSQMSYDLRRLRLKGLITRLPHANTYVLTDEGQRVTIFYTKLHNRLLRPLTAANDPPAPLALRVINHHVDDYISQARMTA